MSTNVIRDFFARQHATRTRKVGVVFSFSFFILIAAFCSRSLGSVTTLTQGAANTLSLVVKVRDQYNANVPGVGISITFSKGVLAGKLRIACDGVTAANQTTYIDSRMSVPRQPAGGSYQCVYTDEKGNKTSLTIPVPTGTLAITSPKAGATIHPSSNVTPPPYTFPPTPTPSGSPTPTSPPPMISPTATPIRGALALRSGFEVHYTFPTFPVRASASVWVEALCNMSNAKTSCGGVIGRQAPLTGTYLLTDYSTAPGAGFDSFPSGASGEVHLNSLGWWSAPPGGFQKVTIEYDDMLSVPIIWG